MGTLGTALITGASSGIGEAYAHQLAAGGYDLILVARREDRLRALADSLRQQFGVRADALAADLTQDVDIERVAEALHSTERLAMLVNNAGFSRVGYFANIPLQTNLDMLKVHVEVTMRLCYAALHRMRSQRYGTIINVASMGAFTGLPNNATYNATKAFLLSFSDSVSLEARDDNVHVQVLCPGFTRTDIFDLAGLKASDLNRVVPPFAWMTPDEVVTESLAALASKKRIVIPGYWNRIYWAALAFPPTAYILKMVAKGQIKPPARAITD